MANAVIGALAADCFLRPTVDVASRVLKHRGHGKIFPELLQAVVGAEQRTEHR
jgi:hypothetical protein